MTTLVPATDHATLWALITAGTAAALWLEQTYRWAGRLSGPVLALLIAMILSNTRVVPTESPACDFVGDWLVPLAIPMLPMRANLREIARMGWRRLLAFSLASLGTLLGIAIAVPLVVGRIFRLNLEELLLAMHATLGGPPTAAAMAISAGWSRLVLPGLLTGLLGAIVGTPLGVMVIEMLLR